METKIVAWTGGDYGYESQDAPLARIIYRDHLTEWKDFWGDFPDNDTKQIFKTRARHDAYATRRAQEQQC